MLAGAETRGVVYHIMRFAVHDGPGIRTTVFFKGCPLACRWCHNPESQSYQPLPMYFDQHCRHCGDCVAACPQNAIQHRDRVPHTDLARCTRCGTCVETCAADARAICGRRVGVSQLLSEIDRDVVFFDDSHGGVTLSGGEPLAQPRFALALLRACRELRLHTTVETCGFSPAATFQAVTGQADLLLFDLKLLDRDRHRRYSGVPNDGILRNLEALAGSGRPLIVRIPVIPGINDSGEDAAGFAHYLSRIGVPDVHLLPYHRTGSDKYRRLGMALRLECDPPSMERLEQFARPLQAAGLKVQIGG